MSGAGHNGGPTMEPGQSWRRYSWTRARADLLPKLPLEVARRRVKRAAELGIDYKSYAGIRAATGRDIIALLFSDNALRLQKDGTLRPDVAEKLDRLRGAEGLGLVHLPMTPAQMRDCHPLLNRTGPAPGLWQTWAQTRAQVLDVTRPLPSDGIVVIGETALERGWAEAGRLGGFIPANQFLAQR